MVGYVIKFNINYMLGDYDNIDACIYANMY